MVALGAINVLRSLTVEAELLELYCSSVKLQN